jgi:hypothetical protein
VLFTKSCGGDQIKRDELDGVYGTLGRDEKCTQNAGRKNQREDTTWETLALMEK